MSILRSRLWVYSEAVLIALGLALIALGTLVAVVALPAPRIVLDGEQTGFGGPGEVISWTRTWERVRACPGQLHVELVQGNEVLPVLDAEIYMHQPRSPTQCRVFYSETAETERYACTWDQAARIPETWRSGTATLRTWVDWDWWCLPQERRQVFPPMTLQIE